MEHYRLQTLLIRAITALCSFAAAESEDVRSELLDEASEALHVWMDIPTTDRLPKLRVWCDGVAVLLGRMPSSERTFLQAQLALLRLRASLPASLPASGPSISPAKNSPPKSFPKRASKLKANSSKLLQMVQSSGPIRSRDLITQLAGKVSERTVKRTLKDLSSAGLVRRIEAAGGVLYEAVVDNS